MLAETMTLPAWRPRGPEPTTDSVADPSLPPRWSGKQDPPAIGDRVFAYNTIGWCKVRAYFVQHGWLGLVVVPEDPPIWYAEQNGLDTPCHVFGAEIGEPEKLPNEGRYRRARVLKRFRRLA